MILRKILFVQIRQMCRNVDRFKPPHIDLVAETRAYQEVLPGFIKRAASNPKLVPEIRNFVREYMEYTLTNQSQGLGFTTAVSYQILEDPRNITEETLHSARVLGWCIEMMQAYFFMLDDILDDSPTRFGRPCWHRLPHVGRKAINDGFLLHVLMADQARSWFGHLPTYGQMKEIFETAVTKILIGQHLDCRTKTTSITYDRFLAICKYKTTASFIDFPTLLIFLLLKDDQLKMTEEVSDICSGLGEFLQMRNDYIDVYGDEKNYKTGTDIQEGKCSWLSAVALKRCNASQRSFFEKHYGSKNPEKIMRIKQLYDDLQMPVVYHEERTKIRQNLLRRIEKLPSERLQTYFNYKGLYNN